MKNGTFFQRLGFAFAGIANTWRSEKSFRTQCMATLAVVGFLIVRRPPAVWAALLLMNCGLVLAAELVNTALERMLDHLCPAFHPEVKVAKDCCAGAVLILSLASVCVFIACIFQVGWG